LRRQYVFYLFIYLLFFFFFLGTCLLSANIVTNYTIVTAEVIDTILDPFMDSTFNPCATNRLQNWRIPFDTILSQYTLSPPHNLLFLSTALQGPNSPGCSPGVTSCPAASDAACVSTTPPKSLGTHVFPVVIGPAGANGLTTIQKISGTVEWNNQLATLAAADYEVPPSINDFATTLKSYGAALCCRASDAVLDARLTYECVEPTRSQEFFLSAYGVTSDLWFTEFQLTATFASQLVCPGWTIDGTGKMSGGAAFVLQNTPTVIAECLWTVAAGDIADGYNLTVSDPKASSCLVGADASTTPPFNVRAECNLNDCSLPNPDLDAKCGLQVMTILDESSSICDTGSVADVRQAFITFLNALNTGPLAPSQNQLAIVEFADTGNIITPTYVEVNSDNIANIFVPYIMNTNGNGYDPCGASSLTAWGNALDASEHFVSFLGNSAPQLTLMITDGEPNVPSSSPLATACQAANRNKVLPTHMFIVGVGAAFQNQDALQIISGPTAWDGAVETFESADYQVLATFDQLGEALRSIVVAFCCPGQRPTITSALEVMTTCARTGPALTLSASSAPASSVGSVMFNMYDQGTLINRNNLLTCTPALVGSLVSFNSAMMLNPTTNTSLVVCNIDIATETEFTFRVQSYTAVPAICEPILGPPTEFDFSAVPQALQVSVSQLTNANCDVDDGSIVVDVSGSNPPYNYSWSNGATTRDIFNLAAGTYSLIVTDSNECTGVLEGVVVTQQGKPTITNSAIGNVRCSGESTGAVSIIVSGGQAPYSYLWSNGATEKDLVNVPAGSYSVTITDARGCVTTSGTFTVEGPAFPLSGIMSSTPTSCGGGTDGTASVVASGGTAPYSYLWTNGGTTASIGDLGVGSYNVTVTDNNACTFVGSTAVSESSSIVVSGGVTQNVSCFEGSNGAISVDASGGIAPYTYSWSTGDTTSFISNVASGFYTVTVKDSNPVECLQMEVYFVSQPSTLPSVVISSVTNSSCPGSTGAVTTASVGGTPPYSYMWSNGADTANLVNVPAGTYSVTVVDHHGCAATAPAEAVVGCTEELRIQCPENVRLQCPADFSPDSTGFPTVTGCDSALPPTYGDSFAPACGNTGTTTRTWTVIGCGQTQSCTQELVDFDTIKPEIFPVVPGGLDNITVPCLSEVPQVPISSVRSTDNCQDPNVFVPCNCCERCPIGNLFPCCDCERPTTVQFAFVPTSCSSSGNADAKCTETGVFPPADSAESYNLEITDYFNDFVYFSGSVASGSAVVINNGTSLVRLKYAILTSGGASQRGEIQITCKVFKRGEIYGSLQVVGMNPGTTCDAVQPCDCCDLCNAVTVTKRVDTAPKCIGKRCGMSSLGGSSSERGACCPGASCRPGAGGFTCQSERPSCLGETCNKDSSCCEGTSCRPGVGGLRCRSSKFRDDTVFARANKVQISFSRVKVTDGEIRTYESNDLCGNVETATQYVIAENTACKRDLEKHDL
jgi:uncharacterized protein YegL